MKMIKILGIMMLFIMSVGMVSAAGLIDDFNRADGNIIGTQDYYGGTYTGGQVSIVNNELYNQYEFCEGEDCWFSSSQFVVDLNYWQSGDTFSVMFKPLETSPAFYMRMGSSTTNDDVINLGAVVITTSGSNQVWLQVGGNYVNSVPFGTFDTNKWYRADMKWEGDASSYSVTQTITDVEADISYTYTNNVNGGSIPKSMFIQGQAIFDNFVFLEDCEADNCLVTNTEPIINSIIPDERIELTKGDSQLYVANVTDDEGDANYVWTLGGIEVSTIDTYLANWDDIAAGIYTLELEVSDEEYTNTASTVLEIRAQGGASGSSLSLISDPVTQEIVEDKIEPEETKEPNVISKTISSIGGFFSSIGNFFGGLF